MLVYQVVELFALDWCARSLDPYDPNPSGVPRSISGLTREGKEAFSLKRLEFFDAVA
jgi:hypothetical protein